MCIYLTVYLPCKYFFILLISSFNATFLVTNIFFFPTLSPQGCINIQIYKLHIHKYKESAIWLLSYNLFYIVLALVLFSLI